MVSGYRLAVRVAVEEQFSKEYRLDRLCGGLLGVSVRRNVAHRTLADALGFERCRHGKDVCSLVCSTTALDF